MVQTAPSQLSLGECLSYLSPWFLLLSEQCGEISPEMYILTIPSVAVDIPGVPPSVFILSWLTLVGAIVLFCPVEAPSWITSNLLALGCWVWLWLCRFTSYQNTFWFCLTLPSEHSYTQPCGRLTYPLSILMDQHSYPREDLSQSYNSSWWPNHSKIFKGIPQWFLPWLKILKTTFLYFILSWFSFYFPGHS